jgi:acyl-CoA reductase-like NAD-dependent aldehyde dehydrogenase
MLMYINGGWNASQNGAVIEVANPATGEVIDSVPEASQGDVEDALQAAQAAKSVWARTPLWKRQEILSRFSDLLQEHKDRLARLLSVESGKPIMQSESEIDTAIRLFRSFPEYAKTLYGLNIPLDQQAGVENDVYITRREPLGIIVGIVPFNFPVDIFSHKVAPALSAGNVIIIKPSEVAPLTILAMTELIYKAGLPDNVLQVITGTGRVVGEMLTQSPLVGGISMTGSTETGIKVATNGAKHLARVMLELGGNDPLIVFEDADLELAVEHTVSGRTLMNGQTCCANKRMIVHRSKVKDFTDLLLEKLSGIQCGDPLNRSIGLGPLIHQQAVQKVHQQVQLTVDQGAQVALGGQIVDQAWYPPTVLVNVEPGFEVAKDMEIFGPVFPIIPFDTDTEAVAIANSSIYGLNGSIFTRDVNRAMNIGYQIQSGIVAVNGTGAYRPDVSFFGGYKMSGLGKEGLIGALEEMTQVKSVAIRNCLTLFQ